METSSPFDLNLAIQHWRENLGQSPALRDENLNELESHLRDSIAMMQTRGLSAEEAFMIAVRRVGRQSLLEAEFAKVNREGVWFDRLLWILIAFQTWIIIRFSSGFATAVLSVFSAKINELLPGFGVQKVSDRFVEITVGLLASPLMMAIVAVIAWWCFIRRKEWLRAYLQKLLDRPWNLALVMFVTCTTFCVCVSWINYHWIYPIIYHQNNNFSYSGVRTLALNLPEFLILALLTFFVARKRLRMNKDQVS